MLSIRLLHEQVFDQDIGQDKRLGITKLPLIDLEAETPKEIELRLLPALDMLKIKDKKDRGTVTIKVFATWLALLFIVICVILFSGCVVNMLWDVYGFIPEVAYLSVSS